MTDSSQKIVLIIEDSADIQAILGRLLKRSGYTVLFAASGRKALDLLKTSERLPKVILLDLMMEDLDGYEFRAHQTRDPRIADIPVILMTADGNVREKSIEVGARAFLKKPFLDPQTILKTVGEFF